jgi:hypothetical protein
VPLVAAAMMGHADVVALLLREGAAVDATGANGAASRGPSLPFRTVVPCPYMGSPYKREWVEA